METKTKKMAEKEKIEYVEISGGIKVRIDNPKKEEGSKLEQFQAKLEYHKNKVLHYQYQIRQIIYTEQTKQNEYLKSIKKR